LDTTIYSIKSISDDEIRNKLAAHQSFVLEDVSRTGMGEAVGQIEKHIEALGLKCRVYTKGRSAAIAGELAVPLVGWVSAAAIWIHNLVTWNPDYEIGKNLLMGTLTLTYKKKK
jgi:hypothetical protein